MKSRFLWCIVRTEILATFHTQVEYISVTKYDTETIGPMGQMTPKSTLPLEARGPPSNTWMPGITPLTTPDSSITAPISVQLCNKGPTGYNGTPHIHPKNWPICSDDHHPHLIHPSLDQPHSPSQMASGSNQPFCHNTFCGLTDRTTDRKTDTDRWSRRMFHNMSTPFTMLIESDALIIPY